MCVCVCVCVRLQFHFYHEEDKKHLVETLAVSFQVKLIFTQLPFLYNMYMYVHNFLSYTTCTRANGENLIIVKFHGLA